MSEHENIEKVKAKRGILSRIQDFFTLGYGTKEDLRELDKKLRDLYHLELQNIRHIWEEVYLKVLDLGIDVSKRDLKKILQTIDLVMERINRADYGYAGLMDRKGHIREEEIARVSSYDKRFGENIEGLKEMVRKTQNDIENESLKEIPIDIKNVKKLLFDIQDKWLQRSKKFR